MKNTLLSWSRNAFSKIEYYYGRNTFFHASFATGMIIKGIDGALEILGSFFALWVNSNNLDSLAVILTQHEVYEDKHSFITDLIIKAAYDLSTSSHYFAFAYLFLHGISKLILVLMLFKKKPWAYPVAEIFLSLFIFVQLYRYSITHSIWLIPFTVIDTLILLVIWLEDRRVRKAASADFNSRR